MGKHKHLKFMDFLIFFGWAEAHKVPKIWEKWVPIIREEHGKKQTFQSYRFLIVSKFGKNEFTSCGKGMTKHRDFPYSLLPLRFRVNENPWNSQFLRMYKFS